MKNENMRNEKKANNLCKKKGTWSTKWRKQLAKWIAHLGRHPCGWIQRFLRTRDSNWLRQQREMHCTANSQWTPRAGRTATRAAAFSVHLRHEDGYRAYGQVSGYPEVFQGIWVRPRPHISLKPLQRTIFVHSAVPHTLRLINAVQCDEPLADLS